MKAWLSALIIFVAAPAFAQQRPPDLPFDSVPDFLQLPSGMNFGEVPGVAVNSKGHVFVFTRSPGAGGGPAFAPATAQLLEFGPNGEFVREIGKNLYAWAEAHSVRIDKDDNIWAIDKGSDMVVKFNQAGRVMMVFGRRKEATDEDAKPWQHLNPPLPPIDGLFREPTDVAWDAAGNIYITDGYINSRVAKYDKDGNWLTSWGERGTGPGQFNLPHAIAIDSRDNIYVGDRTNRRIQVFDTAGKFLRMFTIDVPSDPATRAVYGNTPTGAALAAVSGQPNSICITPGPNQVMFVGESTYPGRIFKLSLDGQVLGVIGKAGRQPKQFSGAHQLACPSDHEVYAAETANWRVQKVTLHPQPPATQSADIRLISSIAIRGALDKMVPEYERATGRHVAIDYGTSAVLKRAIEGGQPFDVAILTPNVIDDLIAEHIIAAGTHTDVAWTDLGVGVRAGAPRGDISTAAALKRRLLAAQSITYSKEGASTVALNDMMRRLSIADEVAPKTVLQTVSGRPAASVVEGENEIVLAPMSELYVSGVQVLGRLPAEFQVRVFATAGIGAASTKTDAAKAFIQFLKSPKMIPLIKASGMEVVR
jgi:ABC-type molybdate transport system substrate-binding protein